MNIFHITSSTTTEVTDQPVKLIWMRLVVTGSPTDWVVQVLNKETPAKVFYVSPEFDAPGTVQIELPQHGDRPTPVPMAGGIDIVTSGTAGVLDAWVETQKVSQ